MAKMDNRQMAIRRQVRAILAVWGDFLTPAQRTRLLKLSSRDPAAALDGIKSCMRRCSNACKTDAAGETGDEEKQSAN